MTGVYRVYSECCIGLLFVTKQGIGFTQLAMHDAQGPKDPSAPPRRQFLSTPLQWLLPCPRELSITKKRKVKEEEIGATI